MKVINFTTYGETEMVRVKEVIKSTITSNGILTKLKTSSESFILNMIII